MCQCAVPDAGNSVLPQLCAREPPAGRTRHPHPLLAGCFGPQDCGVVLFRMRGTALCHNPVPAPRLRRAVAATSRRRTPARSGRGP
ncbi:hypothetical protein ACFPRL_09290 [Pseudoclavibacter helvolus]